MYGIIEVYSCVDDLFITWFDVLVLVFTWILIFNWVELSLCISAIMFLLEVLTDEVFLV